jgi:hypothetical protein
VYHIIKGIGEDKVSGKKKFIFYQFILFYSISFFDGILLMQIIKGAEKAGQTIHTVLALRLGTTLATIVATLFARV